MQKIVVVSFVVVFFFVIACRTVQRSPDTVPTYSPKIEPQYRMLQYKQLQGGYFLRNSVNLEDNINFIPVSSSLEFDSILGYAMTMGNTAYVPDFSNKFIVVIAMRPSSSVYEINISSIYFLNGEIQISYDVLLSGRQDIGYFLLNMKVYEIEKPDVEVSKLQFVNSSTGKVSAISLSKDPLYPDSIVDVIKNYTGTYKGIFLSKKGIGIGVELELNPDYTYTLYQEYFMNRGKKLKNTGTWKTSVDFHSFSLIDDKNNNWMSFEFADKNTIEKLDSNGERIASGLYKLRK
jgi:hypothetical protein